MSKKELKDFNIIVNLATNCDSFVGKKVKEFMEEFPAELIKGINDGLLKGIKRKNGKIWRYEIDDVGQLYLNKDMSDEFSLAPGDMLIKFIFNNFDIQEMSSEEFGQALEITEIPFCAKSYSKYGIEDEAYIKNIYKLIIGKKEESKYLATYLYDPLYLDTCKKETKIFDLNERIK